LQAFLTKTTRVETQEGKSAKAILFYKNITSSLMIDFAKTHIHSFH